MRGVIAEPDAAVRLGQAAHDHGRQRIDEEQHQGGQRHDEAEREEQRDRCRGRPRRAGAATVLIAALPMRSPPGRKLEADFARPGERRPRPSVRRQARRPASRGETRESCRGTARGDRGARCRRARARCPRAGCRRCGPRGGDMAVEELRREAPHRSCSMQVAEAHEVGDEAVRRAAIELVRRRRSGRCGRRACRRCGRPASAPPPGRA